MTKKPAALSADLVAMKGAAVPAPDMPGRASSPAACPATLVTAPDVKPEDKGIARSTSVSRRVPAGVQDLRRPA